MTIEQLCCICVGVIVQAATFALGLLVGASMRRKEPSRDETRSGTAGTDAGGRAAVCGIAEKLAVGAGKDQGTQAQRQACQRLDAARG